MGKCHNCGGELEEPYIKVNAHGDLHPWGWDYCLKCWGKMKELLRAEIPHQWDKETLRSIDETAISWLRNRGYETGGL